MENRDVDQQLPESVVLPLRISRRCVPGEHEPVSIKLLNMSAEPAAVTVRATTPSAGPAVRISTVKPAPTNQRLAAWDPIVPLGDEGLAIPPLEVREVWVDLDCAGVQPGSCEIRLDFEAGASQSHVEIALDVLPFEMAIRPDAAVLLGEPTRPMRCGSARARQHQPWRRSRR